MQRRILLPVAALALLLAAAASADNEGAYRNWNEGRRDEALAEWRRLAEQGDTLAQYNLAVRYLQGDGLPQDRTVAMDWLRRSAEGGSLRSMELLGSLLMSPSAFAPDYAEALKLLTTAAKAGSALAKNNLAVMHMQGLGVPVDLLKAHRYAEEAQRGGADNQGLMAEIERRMSPQQLDEASGPPQTAIVAPLAPPASAATAPPAPAPVPAAVEPPPAPPAAAPVTPAQAKAGWLVHIASVTRRDDAPREWRRQQRANPQLQQFEPIYEDVLLASGAQVTRIFVGGFADRDTARSFCDLVKRGSACLVIRNPRYR
jgi:hypothetical protein